jgi:hypothetical protein
MITIKDFLGGKLQVHNSLSDSINLSKMSTLDCSSVISDEVLYIATAISGWHNKYWIFTNDHFIDYDPKDPVTKEPRLIVMDISNQNSEIKKHIQTETEKPDHGISYTTYDLTVMQGKINKIDKVLLKDLLMKIQISNENTSISKTIIENDEIIDLSNRIENDLKFLPKNVEQVLNKVIAGDYLNYYVVVNKDKLYLTKNTVDLIPIYGENIEKYIIIDSKTYKKGRTGIGGAILGGILFGPLGMAIGGFGDHKKSKSMADVYIKFNNELELIVRLDFNNLNVFVDSNIRIQKSSNDNTTSKQTIDSKNYIAELRELKNLLEEKIITNEEFEIMKSKIINNK